MNEIDLNKDYFQEDIEPIYKEKIEKARLKNNISVYEEIKDTTEKIQNYSIDNNIDTFILWKRFYDDAIFASKFAKDPSKQSIHQKIAADFIKQLPFIYNFELLPAGGKNALYCVNGKILKKKDFNEKDIKSIDFTWKYIFKDKSLTFYATHKHTDDNGGAQDNQSNDVRGFLKNASKCKDSNIYLLSITDGPYYLEKNRIENFNVDYKGTRNYATNTNRLLGDIIPIIIQWLSENFRPEEYKEELLKLNHVLKAFK